MILQEILDSEIYDRHVNPQKYGFSEIIEVSEDFNDLLIQDEPIETDEQFYKLLLSLDYFMINTIPNIALNYICNLEEKFPFDMLNDDQFEDLITKLIPLLHQIKNYELKYHVSNMNIKMGDDLSINEHGFLIFKKNITNIRAIDVDQRTNFYVDENNVLKRSMNYTIRNDYLKTRIKLDGSYSFHETTIPGNFKDYRENIGDLMFLTNDNRIELYRRSSAHNKINIVFPGIFKSLGVNCAIDEEGKIFHIKNEELLIENVKSIKATSYGAILVYLTNENELYLKDRLISSNCLDYHYYNPEQITVYLKTDGYLDYYCYYFPEYYHYDYHNDLLALDLKNRYLSLHINNGIFKGIMEDGTYVEFDFLRNYNVQDLYYKLNIKLMKIIDKNLSAKIERLKTKLGDINREKEAVEKFYNKYPEKFKPKYERLLSKLEDINRELNDSYELYDINKIYNIIYDMDISNVDLKNKILEFLENGIYKTIDIPDIVVDYSNEDLIYDRKEFEKLMKKIQIEFDSL